MYGSAGKDAKETTLYFVSYLATLIRSKIIFLNFQRAKQEDKLNEAITKFNEDQKKAVAETERAALIQRQELLRERESKIWDTEESHLQEKHQTARSQLKDQFLLQVNSWSVAYNF